ncbi:hypothetical protein LguiB_034956 [Lonicera macranthoides]
MSLLPSTTAAAVEGSAPAISALHPDILEAHILTRLDGPSLASASCAATTLLSLSSQDHLWSEICRSTWPSTSSPRIRQVISTFPGGGPRSFFAHSYPLPDPTPAASASSSPTPPELISGVDIHYKKKLIFTKVEATETVTGWFRCSPFRIDLLDPKDAVPTKIQHPDGGKKCTDLVNDMTLSWILMDPIGGRSVNLSSHRPVSVERHWLSGEVQVRFASILGVDEKNLVQCGIVVACGGSEGGEMQVREVSMEMEDMDGMHLNGRDSLVIFQKALEGKKGNGRNREEEGKRRYMEYLQVKRERKERKLRNEGMLDMLCVAFGVSIFASLCCFIYFRY